MFVAGRRRSINLITRRILQRSSTTKSESVVIHCAAALLHSLFVGLPSELASLFAVRRVAAAWFEISRLLLLLHIIWSRLVDAAGRGGIDIRDSTEEEEVEQLSSTSTHLKLILLELELLAQAASSRESLSSILFRKLYKTSFHPLIDPALLDLTAAAHLTSRDAALMRRLRASGSFSCPSDLLQPASPNVARSHMIGRTLQPTATAPSALCPICVLVWYPRL